MGISSTELIGVPFKMIQSPGLVVILNELDYTYRQIYTDGRPLPTDPQPAWQGYSIGRWDGDTLVAQTAGFNDKTWLDAFGHTHSEALRVEERFRRRDFGHMELQITIDDPTTDTKPFTIKANQLLVPDSDVIETVCAELGRQAKIDGWSSSAKGTNGPEVPTNTADLPPRCSASSGREWPDRSSLPNCARCSRRGAAGRAAASWSGTVHRHVRSCR